MLISANLTVSLVNSSDNMANLPLNFFLAKVIGDEEPTSFSLVDLASSKSPSFTSLKEFTQTIRKLVEKRT